MFKELGLDEDVSDDDDRVVAQTHDVETASDDTPALLKPVRAVKNIVGHQSQEKLLLRLYNQGKLPHSLCFTGPKGIGKASFAYAFARFLLHETANAGGGDSLFGGADEALPAESLSVPADSQTAQLVTSGGHPDLLTVEREYDDIKDERANAITVSDIRQLPRFMRATASMGDKRICIIDDADSMNRNAQNALLKILEEPPHNSLIIMVAHSMGGFLPTIRSRIRVLPFEPLSASDFSKLTAGLDASQQDLPFIQALSEGSVGKALSLIDVDAKDLIEEALSCITNEGQPDHESLLKFASKMALKPNEPKYDFVLMIMQNFLEELALVKAGKFSVENAPLLSCIGGQQNLAHRLIDSCTLEALMRRYDVLTRHTQEGRLRYLDKKYIIHQGFCIVTGASNA
tara:strand:- start:193 stop:1398 length:1206 start_codon:yes stop_codon:yes gene_type:complete